MKSNQVFPESITVAPDVSREVSWIYAATPFKQVKHSHLLLLLLLSLLISCKIKEETRLYPDSMTFNMEDVEHFHLTDGRQLDISPALRIGEIALHDTLLVITGQSVANDYRLHIHNIKDGRHLNSFVKLGRGPDEFLYVGLVQVLERRKELYFLDFNSNNGVVYHLDSLLSESIAPFELVRFTNRAYTNEIRIDSTLYLSVPTLHSFIGLEPSYMRFSIYDVARDTFFSRVSLPPLKGIDSVFNQGHLSSIFRFEGHSISFNEYAGKIVLPYAITDLLEIYDYDDAMRRVVRIHGPDRFFPVYHFGRPASSIAELHNPNRETWPVARSSGDVVVSVPGETRYAYFRTKAVEDGFYVLYDGHTLPERDSDRQKDQSRSLLFFLYDGTPVVRYTFDVAFGHGYAVDHQRGVIYIVGFDGEIYSYEIPKR